MGAEQKVPVRLRVVGDSGELLSGITVTAWTAGSRVAGFPLDSGEGEIGPLSPGPAKLVISAPGCLTAILSVDIRTTRDGSPADLREVRLDRGGTTLRGRVKGSPETRPESLPERALLRYRGAGQFSNLTVDGRFEFAGLPARVKAGEGTSAEPAEAAMLVLLRGTREVYARDLKLNGDDLDVGTITLDG